MLLSVVLGNDGEINVIDQARVVKNGPRPSVKFEPLLISYMSKCKDRLSIGIFASISQPYNLSTCKFYNQCMHNLSLIRPYILV